MVSIAYPVLFFVAMKLYEEPHEENVQKSYNTLVATPYRRR